MSAPTILRVRGNEECSQAGLLKGILRCLLQPSVPLSAQAAVKLHHQQQQWPGTRASAGRLLKSLPVELLYDNTGLALFDQITHLTEYYLTEAEASILATAGTDIARACVQDGALMLELGAGSMRKTRLLLNAVERVGCRDVTFVALDLCEDSLRDALTALQGCCSSSIRLVGLVGTYGEGLQHIQDQQAQHSSGRPTQPKLGLRKHAAAAAATASPSGPEDSGSDSPADDPGSAVLQVLFRGGSVGVSSASSGGSPEGSTDAAVAVTPVAAGTGAGACAGNGGLSRQQGGFKQSDACMWSRPKVVLYLGSSIGNCNRDQAAQFLAEVKDKALNPGDFLLLGIDRRNSRDTVSAAYNDTQGVTRNFILNGLAHCCRVLDAALSSSETVTQPPHATTAGPHSSSLKPSDFDYFCLYNEELGRHEAYCQAVTDTVIRLPAASSATESVAGAGSLVADGKEAAAGDSPADGQDVEASCGQQSSCAFTEVHIAAGELISVEFSYKFSAGEVQQLAAGAGLVCVRAWSDDQQRYDLHLLQCRG